MEQASKIYEELEDADDAILGEDEVCKPQLSEDDVLQKKPQDDESKPEEEEQRDFNEIASNSISHVEETSGQDVHVGAVGNDDTAESTFPGKAPEVGQSQPELVAAMHELVPDVEDKAKVEAQQESGALVGHSPKPDSCNQGGKEVQEPLTEAAQDSVKEYEEEGQSASSEQSLEKKGITEEPSEIPGFIRDVGDSLQVGADKDATVLSESVSPLSSSQNQGGEPLATVTMDDQGSGEGQDGIDKDTPGEQDMAKGDGPEGSSAAVQMMSEQEETEISAMEEVAERGDEGWSEDITGDIPPLDSQHHEDSFQETTEPVESELALARESGLDAEMDTSEACPEGVCPDGDKVMDVGERTEIQEAGGDAPRVDNIEGFHDETGDGGQLGTDLNEEDERVLDQQMTDDIEGGGNVGEEGIDHNEKPLTNQEEDQLLSEDTQNESIQPPSQWEESLAHQDANLSCDEPMDTSEGEGGTGATTKELDDGNVGSAMVTSNTTISEVEDSGREQALPAEGSAHAENITSGAEALVRDGEYNNESGVQIKQEILTEVMTEVQADTEAEPVQAAEDGSTTSNPVLEKDQAQDVKPPKAELDSVLDQVQSKQTSLGLGEADSTPASQAKKSKGFSITSIVGRLFDKKEEEARKRKEVRRSNARFTLSFRQPCAPWNFGTSVLKF